MTRTFISKTEEDLHVMDESSDSQLPFPHNSLPCTFAVYAMLTLLQNAINVAL